MARSLDRPGLVSLDMETFNLNLFRAYSGWWHRSSQKLQDANRCFPSLPSSRHARSGCHGIVLDFRALSLIKISPLRYQMVLKE